MTTAAAAPAQAGAGTSDHAVAPDGTEHGPDPDKGKLFEVPRVLIAVDETDPTVIRLAFGGAVELDRANKSDADFYNRLKAGKNVAVELEAHIGTTKTTHRRDSEGNVDAVVQTKSLTVHSIDIAG